MDEAMKGNVSIPIWSLLPAEW